MRSDSKGSSRPTALVAAIFIGTMGVAQAEGDVAPRPPYAEAALTLERFIEREMADKDLPAVSIALVDDQEVVWARGFGLADPKGRVPATAETVYRVGSVSKLFTDIAVMQLAESGALAIDEPVEKYLPEFRRRNPFDRPITLREMMAHRSGLVRESPVGHYFDPGRPTLRETVLSLQKTSLIYAPETRTKYSNAAVAAAGYVLECTQGEPFESYVKRKVLDPSGMARSSFSPGPELAKDRAKGTMWTYDGRRFDAPTFPLGTGPAGNLESTVADLGRFLSVLFARGRGPAGPVLKRETLEQMLKPQFAKAGAPAGFGIGFKLDELDGRRRVGHGGSVYGFATELGALPDEKLGVAVVISLDCANGLSRRIADTALRLMLAARQGKPLPEIESPERLEPSLARRLQGRYGSGDKAVDLVERQGRLFMTPRTGGTRVELRKLGEDLVGDDPLTYGPKLHLHDDRITLGEDELERVTPTKPEPPPERWDGLIGEYGWDHDILYILEKDGQLHALIEWFFLYPLEEVEPNVYRFPNRGLYDGEKLIFRRNGRGRATQVEAASVTFGRRPIEGEDGSVFRIKPLRPVADLRAEALAARPPSEPGTFREPDLVDLIALDPTIRLDIRYAGTENFLGTPLYSSARAFLQRPAAEALVRAHRELREKGYGLLIHDAYRPWHVTKMFWEATPEASRIFVADPNKGSRHNRGSAVDLTLCDLETGRPVPMVGGYDEFSHRSNPDYPGGTSRQRWHRDLLRTAMEEQGFTVNEVEWWHFDHKDWQSYPILNLTFEQLAGEGRGPKAEGNERPRAGR